MAIRYPGVHHGIVDDEDEHHRLVHRQWRQGVNLQDIEEVIAGNWHYYNSPVGAIAWQNEMI